MPDITQPGKKNWPERLNLRAFAGFQLGILVGSVWVFAASGDVREWLKLLPLIVAASILVGIVLLGIEFHVKIAKSMIWLSSGSAIAMSAGHMTAMMGTGLNIAAIATLFAIVLVAACTIPWLRDRLRSATLVFSLMIPSFLIGLESTPMQERIYSTPSQEGRANCLGIWLGAIVIMYAFLVLSDGVRRVRSS